MKAIDLLSAIEDLPENESGALFVEAQGAPIGSILAEGRRVCWATAPKQGRRFRELIRRYSSSAIDPAELERIVVSCHAEGRPIQEKLVERGICSEDAVRAALKQHTIEALVALCAAGPSRVSWTRHHRGGYRASYTMAPLMLLAAVGAHERAGEDIEGAEIGLLEVLPSGAAGASFVIDHGEPILAHAENADRLGIRTTIAQGAWATAAFDACGGFSASVIARGVEGSTGTVTFGWRSSRRVVHIAIIDDREALSRAWAEVQRRRYAAVLTQHTNTISARRGELGAVNLNG